MASTSGRNPAPRTAPTRVEITPGTVVLIVLAIAASVLIADVLVAARRILSWVVACAVAAALIELVAQWLSRWMKRTIAVILVMLAVGAIASSLVFGALNDLDREVHVIQLDAPAAARQLERSDRFGKVAREAQLEDRVQAAVARLSEPSSGLAGQAVSSVGTYTVCIVLTILFLSWGPRLSRSVLNQLDPDRAERLRVIVADAFSRSRNYAARALLQSIAVGLIGWIACKAVDIPAPIPLSLSLAALSLIPNLGIALGALPILLLTFGLDTTDRGIDLCILFLFVQIFSSVVVQPYIVRRSNLYVGPAIVCIAALVGFELYGIGGGLYATALIIFAVATIDSKAEHTFAPGPSSLETRIDES